MTDLGQERSWKFEAAIIGQGAGAQRIGESHSMDPQHLHVCPLNRRNDIPSASYSNKTQTQATQHLRPKVTQHSKSKQLKQ